MDSQVTIIRDSREKEGHGWTFPKSKYFTGTITTALKAGDYAIQGFENDFVVERKGSAGELISNIFTVDKERFVRELELLMNYKRAWIICEFTLQDVANHLNMLIGINFKNRRKSWKPRGLYLTMDKFLGAIASLTIQYNVQFIFAGSHGKELAKKLLLKANKYQ